MSPQTFHRRESFELQVLAAVAAGASSPELVTTQLGADGANVQAALDWAVSAGAASRLDLPSGPSYSLTPTGLQTVGVIQGVDAAVGPSGMVDVGQAAKLVMSEYAAAKDVMSADLVRKQAGMVADDATRDRVTNALNDAYARGALRQDELERRTSAALSAQTMGELRAAADGVVDLPPTVAPVPSGAVGSGATITVNPALASMSPAWWLAIGGGLVGGLMMLAVAPVVGVALMVAAFGLAFYRLGRRPASAG